MISVAPSPVKTVIWDKSGAADISGYINTDYYEKLDGFQKVMADRGRYGLPASKVAKTVRQAVFKQKPKSHYVVTPSYLKDVLIPSLLPARFLDRKIAKALGFN